jgi:hypothetical protein
VEEDFIGRFDGHIILARNCAVFSETFHLGSSEIGEVILCNVLSDQRMFPGSC